MIPVAQFIVCGEGSPNEMEWVSLSCPVCQWDVTNPHRPGIHGGNRWSRRNFAFYLLVASC